MSADRHLLLGLLALQNGLNMTSSSSGNGAGTTGPRTGQTEDGKGAVEIPSTRRNSAGSVSPSWTA
jgi:hypothetical protein